MNFLDELKRRNVIRMAGLCLVGAWLATQVAATLLPVFEAPAWAMKAVVGLLAVGFLPAMVFSLGVRTDPGRPEARCRRAAGALHRAADRAAWSACSCYCWHER